MVRCGLGLTVGPSHGPGVRRQAVVVLGGSGIPKYQPTATVAGGGQDQPAGSSTGTRHQPAGRRAEYADREGPPRIYDGRARANHHH